MTDEAGPATARSERPATAERTVTVGRADGLHLRPLTDLVKRAAAHPCDVRLHKGEAVADAKALLQLLTLAAACGDEITVKAVGPGAGAAVDDLAAFVAAADR